MADMDEDDEILILACTTIIVTSDLAIHTILWKKRHHSVWVMDYSKERYKYGAFNRLMNDLQEHAADRFGNYFSLSVFIKNTFQFLTHQHFYIGQSAINDERKKLFFVKP